MFSKIKIFVVGVDVIGFLSRGRRQSFNLEFLYFQIEYFDELFKSLSSYVKTLHFPVLKVAIKDIAEGRPVRLYLH